MFNRSHYSSPVYISEPELMESNSFVSFNFEQACPDYFACKVAFVVVENGSIVKEKEYLIQPPNNDYHSSFSICHGVTAEDTRRLWQFDKLWPILRSYLRDKFIIAHTLRSELQILNKSLRFYGLRGVRIKNSLCTAELYSHNTIYDIARVLGLNYDKCSSTLLEARLCALSYLKYLDTREIPLELQTKIMKNYRDKNGTN